MARRKDLNQFLNLRGGYAGFQNPGGAVYWVGASGYTAYDGASPSNNNDGLSPQEPFSTIQYALDQCVSGRGDVVAVLPGSYTITAALTMTKHDVMLCSAVPVGPKERSPVVIVNATDVNTIEINANDVTLLGLELDDNVATATADTAAIAVNTASTATDYTNVKIINCFIDMLGSDSDRDGIALGLAGDATDGAIGALVEGCVIWDCDQDAIAVAAGSERTIIRNTDIIEEANGTRYGIDIAAVHCVVQGCMVRASGTACIATNVAAADAVIDDCHIHALGANTIAIIVAATGTQRTAGNWVTATAAGNLIDYTTDNTTPSADAFISNIFAANAGITVLGETTVGGADA